MSKKHEKAGLKLKKPAPEALDLDQYAPFFINALANKLSSSASKLYSERFGVGTLEWRVLGYLKGKPGVSANDICRALGFDKAAASRAVKELERKSLIEIVQADGRTRALSLTRQGRSLHDRILPLALEREQVLLRAFSAAERKELLALLRRLHANVAALDHEPSAER